MNKFIKKYSGTIRTYCLLVMIVTPFLLYFAAIKDMSGLINILLVVMGANMAVALKMG